jgi:hypothetical protein
VALLVVASAFLPMALGHGHETENIEEGQTVSSDPIVCSNCLRVQKLKRWTRD